MATTLIDVLDSAVKIGLGAAISGLTTYIVTFKKTKEDLRLDYIRRKREVLELVGEEIEFFSNAVLSYWSYVLADARIRKRIDSREIIIQYNPDELSKPELSELSDMVKEDKERLEKVRENLESAGRKFISAAKDLSSAESKLMLLGYQ